MRITFSGEPLLDGQADAILDAASSAWCEGGPLHLSVVETTSALDALAEAADDGAHDPLFGAPVLMVFSAPAGSSTAYDDCVAAVCAARSRAASMGLGSRRADTLADALVGDDAGRRRLVVGVPSTHTARCAVLFGVVAGELPASDAPAHLVSRVR